MRRPAAIALCALASCMPPASAPSPAAPRPLRIAVLGDMPYTPPGTRDTAAILRAYQAVLDTIAAERLDFVVHIGDFTATDCGDSVFTARVREFMRIPHPLVYTFGDNEWTDCARDNRDPLERLARLRSLFTTANTSLGARTMPLVRQGAPHESYRENARWTMGGIQFATLHVVGGNNNWGPDSMPSAEYTSRNQANIAWLHEVFGAATRESARGVVVFTQANLTTTPGPRRDGSRPPNGMRAIMTELIDRAIAFDRPVAVVHGDSHVFVVSKPFRNPATGRIVTNLTRAETFGDQDHHALLLLVDPAHPELFRFEPLIVRQNRR